MKRTIIIIISLLFIIGCKEGEEEPKSDPLQDVTGEYRGELEWYDDDHGWFSIVSDVTVSSLDDDFSLTFVNDDTINIPNLIIEVDTIYNITVLENPYFSNAGEDQPSYFIFDDIDNYVAMALRLKSNDPDSVYNIIFIGYQWF